MKSGASLGDSQNSEDMASSGPLHNRHCMLIPIRATRAPSAQGI